MNFKGNFNRFIKKISLFKKVYFIIIYFIILLIYNGDSEGTINFQFLPIYFFDDFYESFKNNNMNDLQVLLLSYYYFNNLEYLIISLILFFGSILCINIFKINKKDSIKDIYNFISNFHFFKKSVNFNFLRKQNVFFQNLSKPSTRIVKKKY